MSSADVAGEAGRRFAEAAGEGIRARGRFACAVPGGSVAERVFPGLARLLLPWAQVDVFWVDERHVDADHPDSNLRAARRSWFDHIAGELPRVHPMAGRTLPPDQAAARAEAELVAALGSPPRLDLAILGVGEDGHVASLFPGHRALDRHEWVVAITDAPKPPPVRLTMTLGTLALAREVWVVAFGAGKAAAIREARTNPESRLPVALVARSGPPVRWFLDEAAAGRW